MLFTDNLIHSSNCYNQYWMVNDSWCPVFTEMLMLLLWIYNKSSILQWFPLCTQAAEYLQAAA